MTPGWQSARPLLAAANACLVRIVGPLEVCWEHEAVDKVDEMLGQEIPGRMGAMMSAPALTIDVRRMQKEGVLGDEKVTFGLSWGKGVGVLVEAGRDAVMLRHFLGGDEVSQEVAVAWTDDRPWFVCPCGRRRTKMYSTNGHAFECRRCDNEANPHIQAFKARYRQPLKRIPAQTRLKVLARGGFRCKVCGSADGLAVVRIEPKLAREEYPEERNATALCGQCRPLFRNMAGRIALGFHVLAREFVSDATSPSSLSLSLDFLDEPIGLGSDGKNAPLAGISIYEQRKKRTKKRQEQRFRVIIRFLAGQSVLEIARLEHISRWTVRRLLNRSTATVAAICQRMVSRAARRKAWREARFWQGCLERLGWEGQADGDATIREIREWRKRLEAFRDAGLRDPRDAEASRAAGASHTNESDDEDEPEMSKEHFLDGLALLRQRMWLATAEFDLLMERVMEAHAEADLAALADKAAERGFWEAIYHPIMLVFFRQIVKDHFMNRAA